MLKKNTIANYISQIYQVTAGIFALPFYLKYMGPESYGLIAFFAMVQIWSNIFDLGLSPTMARETARHFGGGSSVAEYRSLARAVEIFFLVLALFFGGALIAFAPNLANNWFNAEQISKNDIDISLTMMALIIALRWLTSYYRSLISGAELFVLLSYLNISLTTVRFIAVIPVMIYVDQSALSFFKFQLAVSILELLLFIYFGYRILPKNKNTTKIKISLATVTPVIKFSLSVAFTTLVWTLVSQTDKLLLSSILPLSEYGYFAAAVLAASGIMMSVSPLAASLMPRMSNLYAANDDVKSLELYMKFTQIAAIVVAPLTLILAIFPKEVLWAWTGDVLFANQAAVPLTLYAIGYGFLAIGAFPFYLQYAKGDLRLHLLGSSLFLIVLTPSLVWAAREYGMQGAGWVWLTSNLLHFFFWIPIVHKKFEIPHLKWLFSNVVLMFIVPFSLAFSFKCCVNLGEGRLGITASLFLLGLIMVGVGFVLSERKMIMQSILVKSKGR